MLLTVPASFDAVARELTVTAARQAGLAQVTLLEEPQAAFYAWLAADRRRAGASACTSATSCWSATSAAAPPTSRSSRWSTTAGNLALERVAVGDHILLGGDNMDLALAHARRASAWATAWRRCSSAALVHACRRAKEQLLAADAPEQLPVVDPRPRLEADRRHRRALDLQREHVRRLILDGFFPFVDAPPGRSSAGATGLRELGLPYAHDPAITRHLAEFLGRHGRAAHRRAVQRRRDEGRAAARRGWPRWSGGWPGRAASRRWPAPTSTWPSPTAPPTTAWSARGRGIRIRGGTARSYYIGIEARCRRSPASPRRSRRCASCRSAWRRAPRSKLPDEELGLVVGETAEFRFFAASDRKDDPPGALLDPERRPSWTSWTRSRPRCPPAAGAEPGTTVPVSLESHLTEVGTLELWCVARDGRGRWKLEYSVRERS